MSRPSLRRVAGAVGLAAWLAARLVSAEPTPAEKATAEALFQRGAELMAEKRFAAACEKFEGSQQLDRGLGTMLRLADCYDRLGKTASAWALFREGASLARSRGESDREHIASERANELEKRLSKIELRVDRKTVPAGIEIQLNGVVVPRATWDTPLPVDPGPQRVAASAPERQPWNDAIDIPEGAGVRVVDIPVLPNKGRAEPREAPTALPPSVAAEPSTAGGGSQRAVGYVAGGLALVSFAVGGVLAYRAYDVNQQSLSQCSVADANACTPQGRDRRNDAHSLADGATLAFIGGGALLAGGVVLVLTARSSEPRPATARELKAQPTFSANGAGFRLEGTW